jgi:hypothetical protein
MNMKSLPLIVVLIFLAIGCNNRSDELQQQIGTLQNSNNQLKQDLNSRDEYVNKITDSINAVYLSIEDLRLRESAMMKEKTALESTKKMTQDEIRARLGERINYISAILSQNHKRINDLQAKLAASKKQYAGLKKIVDNLTKTLEERDSTIARLGVKVQGLERDVNDKNLTITEKNAAISQRDSVIASQHGEITTSFFISGTREDLEKMGIIKKEGGFPWGLFGSTMTLGTVFDKKYFKPIDNTSEITIQVDGKIEQVIPKRNAQCYKQATPDDGLSTLTITDPVNFWKDKYLVIVTDRQGTSTVK